MSVRGRFEEVMEMKMCPGCGKEIDGFDCTQAYCLRCEQTLADIDLETAMALVGDRDGLC